MFSRCHMNKSIEKLLLQLAERHCAMVVTSTRHLSELQEEVEGKLKQDLLNEDFFQERLAWFEFKIPETLPEAQTLIVVAVPRPQSQAIFTWNGKRQALILPPTYTAYDETTKKVQVLLEEILGRDGYRVASSALPLKLLSVRSGLAEYGRNNISYVPGMGSFFQLVAVYSDMPCERDQWREAKMMKSCQECQLCRQACPTGAIPSDRFLLRAERCIVYHNERKGNIPFPEWMDPAWHNCVVGCLHCQRVCPHNRNFLQWIGEKEEFTEKETELLLEGTSKDRLTTEMLRKLGNLSLIDYLDNLPRNLSVFFRKDAL